MPKKKNRDDLIRVTGGDFIDPLDTGSFIRYKAHVYVSKADSPDKDYINVDFTMSLGDCNRVITWDFEEYDSDSEMKLEKIDKAIEIMLQAKAKILEMEKVVKKERARIEAAKKAVQKAKKV
jgi:hypothetical protein